MSGSVWFIDVALHDIAHGLDFRLTRAVLLDLGWGAPPRCVPVAVP